MSAADAGRPVSEAEVLLARREARRFSMRENEAGPELRFGDLDGIVFEDGLDECIGANLVLWLNRMLISAKDAVLRENVERERLDQAAATRPAPAGDGELERLRAEVDMLRRQRDDFAERLIGEPESVLLRAQRDAEARATAAEAALAEARAVLRQVEWKATSRHAGFAPAPACPCCGGIIGPEGAFPGVVGHAPGCALAAILTPTERTAT